ncbi:MAG: DoxX family protein [Pseudomonadota bacterium]
MKSRLNAYAPIILGLTRIMAGLLFLAHGTQKMFQFPATDWSPEFLSQFWWAGVIETVTGCLIAVGFQTRPAAFLASGTMAAAYWIAHAPDDFFPVNNNGDAAILFCFFFLYLVFAGPGKLSLDGARG